jgi:hypothetical protein
MPSTRELDKPRRGEPDTYVPQLDTYIGPETPNPLFITLLRWKKKFKIPAMKVVLTDIVGLTKINYNSCNYNDALPVTVRFAKTPIRKSRCNVVCDQSIHRSACERSAASSLQNKPRPWRAAK